MVAKLVTSFREEQEGLSRASKMISKTTNRVIRKPTSPIHKAHMAYLTAVKDTLEAENRSYQDFTQLLKEFRFQRLDIEGLIEMVKVFFKGHPDLLMGFNTFLPKGYKITTKNHDDLVSKDVLVPKEALTFVKRVKARFRDEPHVFSSFIAILRYENKYSIFPKIAALFRDQPDLIDEFTQFLPSEEASCAVDDGLLSDCETCTPSYRVLPEDHPIVVATRRTLRDSEVLNDRVCITPSAASCSKGTRKTRYEQSLFQCESDMFELDMLLSHVNSTIQNAEKLLEKIENNSTSEFICFDDHLTVHNIRCIEKIYGKQGLEVVGILREKAQVALPVILDRLKQKQDEWELCRSDFGQVWSQVYAKNINNQAETDSPESISRVH